MATLLKDAIDELKGPLHRLLKMFQGKKEELAKFRADIAKQERIIGALDKTIKDFIYRRRRAIWNKVLCIRQSGHSERLPAGLSIENVLEHERKVQDLYESLAIDGLGKMFLFLRTKAGETNAINFTAEPKKTITLQTPNREKLLEILNPFRQVFKGTDRVGQPPGSANFEQFQEHITADLSKGNGYYIAYGPSGAGKSTLSMLMLEHLLHTNRGNCTIKCEMLYPTMKAQKLSFEKFDWKNPGKEDVTKIFLSEIELIQKVGVSLHQYSRDLYRIVFAHMGFRECNDKVELVDACVEVVNFEYVLNEEFFTSEFSVKKYDELPEHLKRKDVDSFAEALHFKPRVNTYRADIIAHVKQYIDLCNSTRNDLRRRVSERLNYEMTLPFSDKDSPFFQTGGFIPYFWLMYGTENPVCFNLSFFRDLNQCNYPVYVYDDFYLRRRTGVETYKEAVKLAINPYLGDGSTQKPKLNYAYNMAKWPFLEGSDVVAFANKQYRFRYIDLTAAREQIVIPIGTVAGKVIDSENDKFVFDHDPKNVYNKPVAVGSNITELLQLAKKCSFQRSTPQNQSSSRCATKYEIVIGGVKTIVIIDLPGNEEQINDCGDSNNSQRCVETKGIYQLLRLVRLFIALKRYGLPLDDCLRLLHEHGVPHSLLQFFEGMFRVNTSVGFLCFAAEYNSSPNYLVNTEITLKYVSGLFEATLECDSNPEKRLESAGMHLAHLQSEPAALLATDVSEAKREQPKTTSSNNVNDNDLEELRGIVQSNRVSVHLKIDPKKPDVELIIKGNKISEQERSNLRQFPDVRLIILENVTDILLQQGGKPVSLFTELGSDYKLDDLKYYDKSLIPIHLKDTVNDRTRPIVDLIKSGIAIEFRNTCLWKNLDPFGRNMITNVYAGTKGFDKRDKKLPSPKEYCYIYVLDPSAFHYKNTDQRSITKSYDKYKGLSGIMTVQSITSGGGSTRKKKEATKMKTRSSK